MLEYPVDIEDTSWLVVSTHLTSISWDPSSQVQVEDFLKNLKPLTQQFCMPGPHGKHRTSNIRSNIRIEALFVVETSRCQPNSAGNRVEFWLHSWRVSPFLKEEPTPSTSLLGHRKGRSARAPARVCVSGSSRLGQPKRPKRPTSSKHSLFDARRPRNVKAIKRPDQKARGRRSVDMIYIYIYMYTYYIQYNEP